MELDTRENSRYHQYKSSGRDWRVGTVSRFPHTASPEA